MIIEGHAINQDIIKEYNDKATEKWLKNHIHCRLERRQSITQTKGHNLEFLVPMVRVKCRFSNVQRMHLNLVVAMQQIQFQKPVGST